MRLDHLEFTVPDVARSRECFETYFGCRRVVTCADGNVFHPRPVALIRQASLAGIRGLFP
jgi:hypothetical protein